MVQDRESSKQSLSGHGGTVLFCISMELLKKQDSALMAGVPWNVDYRFSLSFFVCRVCLVMSIDAHLSSTKYKFKRASAVWDGN